MRYQVEVPAGVTVPPLHETEDDDDNLTDAAHTLFIGDLVEVEGDIKDKRRVLVTTLEPTPRKGWFSTRALKPAVGSDLNEADPGINEDEFYYLLRSLSVGQADHRYLFALAIAEGGLQNATSSISGPGPIGPFQYTSERWTELLTAVGAGTELKPEDRTAPAGQARLAVAEAVDAMKKVETALSRSARRNELYLIHVLPPIAADAFLNVVKEEKLTSSIDDILRGVPNAAHVVEQHSKLLNTATGTATVSEALDLAASALQPGLDSTVELDPPPLEMVALPDGLTVFEAKCLTYMPKLMTRFGLTDVQAAGVFGNLGTESAGFTAFHEKGQPEDKGGYGWAQWTADRRIKFFNWCNDQDPKLQPESDDASYGYLCAELEDPRAEAAAITALKDTNTLQEAVEAFERTFERAGVKGIPSRLAWAEKALTICRNPPQQSVASNQADTTTGAGPRWVAAGLQDIPFHETGDNEGIEKFIRQARCGRPGNRWCAIWANAKLEVSGIRGTRSALAVSFRNHPDFIKLDGPALGAIVVWNHHVGFYLGQSSSRGILTLGGNQSNSVCKTFNRFSDNPDFWWPKSELLPVVGPIHVESSAGNRGGSVV